MLLSKGFKVNSHSALKTIFGLNFIKTGKIDKKYARYLSHLKDERENGDYDIFVIFDKEDAKRAMKEAQDFLEGMKKYLKI